MDGWMLIQARSQVSRFGGAQYIFGEHDFGFYYMFKTNFSGHNKIWGGTKKFGAPLPSNEPLWLRACAHYRDTIVVSSSRHHC